MKQNLSLSLKKIIHLNVYEYTYYNYWYLKKGIKEFETHYMEFRVIRTWKAMESGSK